MGGVRFFRAINPLFSGSSSENGIIITKEKPRIAVGTGCNTGFFFYIIISISVRRIAKNPKLKAENIPR